MARRNAVHFKTSKMAESQVEIPMNQPASENRTHSDSQRHSAIEQWQVQYARFINYSSSSCGRTHPALTPISAVQKKRLRCGSWISSTSLTATSLLLMFDRSKGFNDAILVLSLQSKLLEEHYISKLHFSWPQVSCVSGFPSRGSRAVIASYKDGVGQIQKFAFRFLTNFGAEQFVNVLKEILDSGRVQQLPCTEFNSNLSYQAESVPSVTAAYRPQEDWLYTTSVDASTHPVLTINEAQDSNTQQNSQNGSDEEKLSAFPPSFTSLLMNCCPTANEAKPAETEEVDLKTQLMQFLQGSSFKDVLATVENVIKELGDDIVL